MTEPRVQPLSRSDQSGLGQPRLRGWRLGLARVAWVACLALALGVFVATMPARFGQLRQIAAANHSALLQLELTDDVLATYVMALDSIVLGAFVLVAILIFWRRSSDPAALYASLALVVHGAELTRSDDSVLFAPPALHLPIVLVIGLGTVLITILLFIFPDGRFVPSWTRWLAIAWSGFVLAWHLVPIMLTGEIPWPPSMAPLPLVILVLVVGLGAQIYRYRRVSSAAQRQQTKWVVFGLGGAIQGALWFLLLAPILLPDITEPGLTRVAYILIGVPFFYLTVLLLPLSIGLSILRYRLWNIDRLINRALVYTLLTGLLLGIYFGGVVLLQSGFRALTGQESELAVIVSTLTGAALFQPLRNRVQRLIDRRFYRRKYDAARALAAFGERVRDDVDPTTISEDVLAIVQETVQPSRVSLWLREPRAEPTGANIERGDWHY